MITRAKDLFKKRGRKSPCRSWRIRTFCLSSSAALGQCLPSGSCLPFLMQCASTAWLEQQGKKTLAAESHRQECRSKRPFRLPFAHACSSSLSVPPHCLRPDARQKVSHRPPPRGPLAPLTITPTFSLSSHSTAHFVPLLPDYLLPSGRILSPPLSFTAISAPPTPPHPIALVLVLGGI